MDSGFILQQRTACINRVRAVSWRK